MTFEDLGGGRTRMIAVSIFNSVEGRDGQLASGMESGINTGYRKLDNLLANNEI